MELKPEILDRLKKLDEKYQSMGQDLVSYLDGLLYADYLTYWDYIHLDTLLSLQNPKTSIPDEEIFIMYHQITELYFKLCMHEFNQLEKKEKIDAAFLTSRVNRINRYFGALTHSFSVMVDGMDPDQFLKFRMSLLPASGFQSAQYREIEICSTSFINLVEKDQRQKFSEFPENNEIEEMYAFLYWKKGATELSSGKKTLTLKQFEDKYNKKLIDLAINKRKFNLLAIYNSLSEEERKDEGLINALKLLDVNVNINWPLSHYKSAVRYLQKDPVDIAATGGTNWQKYLPPRFQKRIFYPELWNDEEVENWGKNWVKTEVFGM
ncbi:MAG: tryptophan 2,3-dioxygenase [Bacteroidetes bacterium]|nr:tryptophan 2,3-dioxygenase [Bacteroidota bacterium]HET6245572.1 tryptophan 2,3-dioxygenase family protein [Bacteroidia bacterium]